MTKFTIALREIGTYKEVLRSQVKFSVSFVSQFYVVCYNIPSDAVFLNSLFGEESSIGYFSRDDFKTSIQYFPFLWWVLLNYFLVQLLSSLIFSIWLLSNCILVELHFQFYRVLDTHFRNICVKMLPILIFQGHKTHEFHHLRPKKCGSFFCSLFFFLSPFMQT